jgi:hypothetical protein
MDYALRSTKIEQGDLFDKLIEQVDDKDVSMWQDLLLVINHGTNHTAWRPRIQRDRGMKTQSQDYSFFGYAYLLRSLATERCYKISEVISLSIPAASSMVTGMVSNQVTTISPPTCQRTLLTRSADPAPTRAMLMICEVLTGAPMRDEVSTTPMEATCDASEFMGLIT